jgi:putative hydrolase of the HAD superfamily
LITTFFIDLDDTLYPHDNGVWHAIGARIQEYLIQRLGLDAERADKIRATYLHQFGTTLNGLRAHHNVDPFDYLAFVHDIPLETMLKPDEKLRQVLSSIPQRKIIFTNASREHAQRVITLLGISDLIEQIIDIVSLEFVNKPDPAAYQRALSLSGDPDPAECIMIDDRANNLVPAGALGFTTILVGDRSNGEAIDYRLPSIYELHTIWDRLESDKNL